MPERLYELRVFRGDREVHDATFLTSVDLDDPVLTRDLLNRHLVAAAERAGASRSEAYLFRLEARQVHEGRGYGDPVFRWALPINPEGMYR